MLTDSRIKGAQPEPGRVVRLSDGSGIGLELHIQPGGSKLWRWRYRWQGKARMLSLGSYPDRTLAGARTEAHALRALLGKGIDPSAERKARAQAGDASAGTFAALAAEWFEQQKAGGRWTTNAHPSRIWRRLETAALPYLGPVPVEDLTAQDVLACCKRVEARGLHETAHRLLAEVRMIVRYAVATGRARHDVTASLTGALTPVRAQSFRALIEPHALGELLRAIAGYRGSPVVRLYLQLLAHLFTRPSELRLARWEEVERLDSGEPLLRVPAERTKRRAEHLVPLSPVAVRLLREELLPLTGAGEYLFPGHRSPRRPMSDAAAGAALKGMGYEVHPHGFRSSAASLLTAQGFGREVIELQLAHVEPGVRKVYQRHSLLSQRRDMMCAWSDYLARLEAEKPIRSPARTIDTRTSRSAKSARG